MSEYVGIDLALPGRRRRTGLVAISTSECKGIAVTVAERDEIIGLVIRLRPRLICIDAPLSRPKSGCNRLIEVKARRMGLRLLPPLLGPMRLLTEFAIEIANALKGLGFRVIEVHPTSTLRVLGVDRSFMRDFAKRAFNLDLINEHELDAFIAALTCYFYDMKCHEEIWGFEDEGFLVIPKRECVSLLCGLCK